MGRYNIRGRGCDHGNIMDEMRKVVVMDDFCVRGIWEGGCGKFKNRGQQQLPHAPKDRAFSLASSSSAWAAQAGVGVGDRKMLSLLFSSFSRSMESLRVMMACMRESNSCGTPVEQVRFTFMNNTLF